MEVQTYAFLISARGRREWSAPFAQIKTAWVYTSMPLYAFMALFIPKYNGQ